MLLSMPQIPMTIQPGKLEKDMAGKGGMGRGRATPSGAKFSVLVHGEHPTQCRHGNGGKEQASPVEGDQDYQKTLKASPHFHKGPEEYPC